MPMSLLAAFMIALISTLVIGALARIVVDLFSSSNRTAPIAGVSVAAGFALARSQYRGPMDIEALVALGSALGSLLAVALLWYALIKRPARQSGYRDN